MNILPARLTVEGNAPLAIIGAGRPDELRIRLPPWDGAAAYRDSDVMLGIRPESIAESGRRFGPSPDATLAFDADVEMIEPTGAETIVLLRVGGMPVLARVAADVRPPPGAPAAFVIDTNRICLFDPISERLIA